MSGGRGTIAKSHDQGQLKKRFWYHGDRHIHSALWAQGTTKGQAETTWLFVFNWLSFVDSFRNVLTTALQAPLFVY